MKVVSYNLKSALKYSKENRIEEWIHEFLLGEGNNTALSEGLKLFSRFYYGPVKLELTHFERCCGPEKDKEYIIDKLRFEEDVKRMINEISKEWDVPPLIVNYENKKFKLNDGNHRYEAMKRSGINEYYVIIWTTDEKDMNEFKEIYRINRNISYHLTMDLNKARAGSKSLLGNTLTHSST